MRRFVSPTLFVLIAVLIATGQSTGPEPAGWYAGDMHVHRSCGGAPVTMSSIANSMNQQNLAALSLLADMGNAEVQNATTDLPLVNGSDASVSTPGHIVHWDAEWHWDATYTQYAHQALGGHLVGLGLKEAHQIWNESTYPILDWAHQQNAVAGFAHLQYLSGTFPSGLNCCTPVEYPVEVALGTADFISEDVTGSDTAIDAYYRLLNSGFRPGFAAGTDYPCNDGTTVGNPLTYVRVAGGQMTYRNWVDGISNGHTVVSRNGHNEFVNLTVNGTAGPGDQIDLAAGGGTVTVQADWTANQNLNGTLELVVNGTVVASKQTSVTASTGSSLTTSVPFTKSGWIAARRMDSGGHVVHTAAMFVIVNGAPIRANATDATYFAQWAGNLISNTSFGGPWNSYFPTELTLAQGRYSAAQSLFQQIARDAQGTTTVLSSISVTPSGGTIAPGKTQQFLATGTYSDGSTQNLTGQVTWATSNPSAVTINMRGLAAGVAAGTAVISARMGQITGSTSVAAQVAPLAITTTSLPGGVVNVAYSATLAASAGTQPYTWSIATGSLPAGVSLDSATAVISGTPTTAGTYSFTVQVTDASAPVQSASANLSITIASAALCPCTIWPSTAVPTVPDSGPDSAVEIGVRFKTDVNGYISAIRFYKGTGNTGTHVGNLWNSSGTLLASATFTNETASGWQQVNFSSPVPVTAGPIYVASYHTNVGHYAADETFFASGGVDNPPLHALQDGVSGPDGVYNYGSTSTFPTLGFRSGNYWVDVVLTGTAALTSIAVTPTAPSIQTGQTQQFTATGTFSDSSTGNITSQVAWTSSNTSAATINATGLASAVAAGTTTITAKLGSISGTANLTVAPGPLTITTSTLASGLQNQPYSATLAAVGGTTPYAWSLATGSALPAGLTLSSGGQISGAPTVSGTFTFTVRVSDAGSPQQSTSALFTLIINVPAAYLTIWSDTIRPGTPDAGPDSAVELGVKFTSDVAGSVTGIRFYKSTANTGTHTAHLWNSAGASLATATFSNETASGWQQVNFTTPVAINAGVTYVASYHTNVGHYSDDTGYFASPLSATPLHVPVGGGVFAYGSSSNFPTGVWNNTNYWVDLMFVPSGPDTTSPIVSSVTPVNGATGVDVTTAVMATFNEPINAASVNSTTFVMLDQNNVPVTATVSYDSASLTAKLIPTTGLAYSTLYTATIKGGANGVKDVAGNALVSDYTWSFTTAGPPPPPPSQGPGGPILAITSTANPYSMYAAEILRNEGLNLFATADISQVTTATLANYQSVVLGQMSLTAAQVSLLSTWVNGGGTLIALRPDKQLAGLLGLTDAGSTLADKYLTVNTAVAPGAGIVNQSIQFHGAADLYTLNGASAVATLYSSSTTATQYPAVTQRAVGAGVAAAFTYDLARSIVYTRQGNPAWAGQSRDGQSGPIRSDNLFFGDATFDPQPDYVDLNKVAIPQADEQQRLLVNMTLQLNAAQPPLPRFWYLPKMYKAAVVLTGDDHGDLYGGGATAARFDQYLAASPAGCSVADWQCVRASAYVMAPSVAGNPLTNAQAASYVAQGFEIGSHMDSVPDCSDWTTTQLDSFYTTQMASFEGKYTSVPAQKTHRMHCIGWSDYDSQPKVEYAHGIRLDTNYYYWPPSWVNDTPGLFTGSGMPMRFMDKSGNLLDVYQATTQMTDESGQTYPFTVNTLLDNAVGTKGYYGVFTANMHNDTGISDGADEIVASAQTRGVPIISAAQLLTWLDGRNGSSFSAVAWNSGTLTFTIVVGSGANGLQTLLPAKAPTGPLVGITLNGSPVTYTTATIKGVSYAVFAAAPGTYQASYVTVPLPDVTGLTLNPTTVPAGTASTGTVTLAAPAPAGMTVALASSDTNTATVPASVAVATGSTTATFTVSTKPVLSATNVTITATSNKSATAVLSVTPVVALGAVSVNPTTVVGGNPSTGTVTLNIPSATDTVVALASSNTSVATVSGSVTVPAGATSATFPVNTVATASTATVTITATYNSVNATASLTVTPTPAIAAVSLNPASVTGGNSSVGTVSLNVASTTDIVAALQSSDTSAATVPASVTVPAGATSATFTVSTAVVNTLATVTISATYNGTTRTAALTVNPVAASALTLNPTSVLGGRTSTGTVTVSPAAPTGGAVVTLASANTAVATVPASVTVAAGATTATFTITTVPVGASTPVQITATRNGIASATLTVTPVALSSVAVNPTGVTGGTNSTGTVTLTGAAPSSGVVVTLTSSNTNAARVPASVTVASGATTATFTITTSAVTANATVTISAISSGVTRTATLTVRTPALNSVTLNPTSVKGGTSSTGTVTLSGPAPSGGSLVSLRDNSQFATVPANVTVAAGATTATFTVTTSATTARRTATITATFGGVNRTASLTITP